MMRRGLPLQVLLLWLLRVLLWLTLMLLLMRR